MPQAFLDFRNLFYDLTYEIEKNCIEPEIVKLKIQQKINPLLRKLDAEIKGSLLKIKLLGMGLPIVSGAGVLVLSHYGIDVSKIGTILYGGVGVSYEFKVLSDFWGENKLARANPLYYLWKVNQQG